MKTLIEVHNGIPLGMPREWSKAGLKVITHKGSYADTLVLCPDGSVRTLDCAEFPNQTAALEWIAKQIKDSEKE